MASVAAPYRRPLKLAGPHRIYGMRAEALGQALGALALLVGKPMMEIVG